MKVESNIIENKQEKEKVKQFKSILNNESNRVSSNINNNPNERIQIDHIVRSVLNQSELKSDATGLEKEKSITEIEALLQSPPPLEQMLNEPEITLNDLPDLGDMDLELADIDLDELGGDLELEDIDELLSEASLDVLNKQEEEKTHKLNR